MDRVYRFAALAVSMTLPPPTLCVVKSGKYIVDLKL